MVVGGVTYTHGYVVMIKNLVFVFHYSSASILSKKNRKNFKYIHRR